MGAEFVRRFPALTFASGPTNSLRGAAQLTGREDAVVVDIGGTTTDIGVLQHGFPRQSNHVIEVGGIRTNFRMPDILSIGLGGGSLVEEEGRKIGPRSVGYRLLQQGRIFGGDTLTTTDVIVASGALRIGDPARVANLDRIGGEADRLVSYKQVPRAEAIQKLTNEAVRRAIHAGADAASVRVVDVEETALGYMDEGSARLKIKVVGEIAVLAAKAPAKIDGAAISR